MCTYVHVGLEFLPVTFLMLLSVLYSFVINNILGLDNYDNVWCMVVSGAPVVHQTIASCRTQVSAAVFIGQHSSPSHTHKPEYTAACLHNMCHVIHGNFNGHGQTYV